MTSTQKRILLVLAVAIALTRPLAVAHSLNDWDEALFSSGVAEYDVSQHHPHPPGYPLFIAAAKGVHLLGLDEYRSLQIVVLLGASLLFPALFFLASEVGFSFTTSVIAAALFAFIPNVWVYGGTGFSDVPSIALAFTACALLLRGRRDRRAYLLGAIVLGMAAGFRLPNLVLGAVPALVATGARLRARDFRGVAAAIVLGGVIVSGCYVGAAVSSQGGIAQYRETVRQQAEYVRAVDSWHNPGRAPLGEVAKRFFMLPFEHPDRARILIGLALVGIAGALAGRQWRLLLPLAIFSPVMILSWLNLDVEAAGRYAIAYLGAYALFAAYGLQVLGRKAIIQSVLAAIFIVVLGVFAWPGLRLQRNSDAPAAGALLWIRRNVPTTSAVYVHGALGPQASYLLPHHRVVFFERPQEILRVAPEVWIVEPRIVQGGMNFVWPRDVLWKVLRHRNFEAAVMRLESYVQFGNGWYDAEGEGANQFRWMGKEASVMLPAVPGTGTLSLRMYVPVDTIQPAPTIEVWVNETLVERIVSADALVDRSWSIASRKGAPNELRLKTSAVVIPAQLGHAGDTRELGLRIDSLTWTSSR